MDITFGLLLSLLLKLQEFRQVSIILSRSTSMTKLLTLEKDHGTYRRTPRGHDNTWLTSFNPQSTYPSYFRKRKPFCRLDLPLAFFRPPLTWLKRGYSKSYKYHYWINNQPNEQQGRLSLSNLGLFPQNHPFPPPHLNPKIQLYHNPPTLLETGKKTVLPVFVWPKGWNRIKHPLV